MLHGPESGAFDLRFEIPAVCASLLRSGEVDIGLVPAIELARQPLERIPGQGIASREEVRSILLVSKVPASAIRTLAVDASSRTSVVLTRLVLAERFGARPTIFEALPDVAGMLTTADACLVIGDPALRFERKNTREHVYDLGAEWSAWTGLPMVYAVWAARSGFPWSDAAGVLLRSWQFGRERIDEIAAAECGARGISTAAAREYLTRNIRFEIGAQEEQGLELFLGLARSSGMV